MPTNKDESKPNAGDVNVNEALKKALTAGASAGSAVEVDMKLSIDVERLNADQLSKLLAFLVSLDNSPAAALGAGIGKK